jgi:type IV secretory pathway TraG/TraD family ATPase VirD4
VKNDPYLIEPNVTINLNGTTIPLELLFRGLLVTGQPGVGKTRGILMPIIRQILKATGNAPENKTCLIVSDPKNELTPFLAEACAACGRSDDLVILRPGEANYNPLTSPFMSESEVVEKLILFAAHTNRSASRRAGGDELFWALAQRSLLGAVVAVARATHPKGITFAALGETLDRINRLGALPKVTAWLADYQLPETAIQSIENYLRLPPETTRPCVNVSVQNTIHFWRAEPLAQLTAPAPGVREIDPIEILDQGKILAIACTSAAYGASITPFLTALKEHFFSAILSRDQIEVEGQGVWRLINQQRPILMASDEFQSYVTIDSSAGEVAALDRMRSFRAGLIATTQNLASLHSALGSHADATRLISLFSNQIFMANACPYTASQASWIMGTKPNRSQTTDRMAPPLMSGYRHAWTRSNTGDEAVRVPRVDSHALASLKTGEYWARWASGKVEHKTVARDQMLPPPTPGKLTR